MARVLSVPNLSNMIETVNPNAIVVVVILAVGCCNIDIIWVIKMLHSLKVNFKVI